VDHSPHRSRWWRWLQEQGTLPNTPPGCRAAQHLRSCDTGNPGHRQSGFCLPIGGDPWTRTAGIAARPWVAASAAVATVLLISLPARSGESSGLPAAPGPGRPGTAALDLLGQSLDRCANALRTSGLADRYPDRSAWQPLAHLVTSTMSVTLLTPRCHSSAQPAIDRRRVRPHRRRAGQSGAADPQHTQPGFWPPSHLPRRGSR